MTPRLMPCRSSPPAGSSSTMNMSTMSDTAVSDWPTPTVSTITVSKPAASTSSMVSRVRRATPPRVAPAGEGRMKAPCRRDSSSMRVLSPRIEPPPRLDEGSMASTASERPLLEQRQAEALDEGRLADARHAGDAEPHRFARVRQQRAPAAHRRARDDRRASNSIRVMAWASARRSPASSGSSSGSTFMLRQPYQRRRWNASKAQIPAIE